MRRHRRGRATVAGLAIAVTMAALALSGCAKTRNTPTGTTAAHPSPTAEVENLTGKGVGPYTLGASLTGLKASGKLDSLNESTGCPKWATANATGAYLGVLTIVFYDGKIAWVATDSPKLSTVEGATVGMPLSAVKDLYAPKATSFDGGLGLKAVGVPQDGGSGLFFRSTKDGKTVAGIEAGTYETLTFRFTDGEGC